MGLYTRMYPDVVYAPAEAGLISAMSWGYCPHFERTKTKPFSQKRCGGVIEHHGPNDAFTAQAQVWEDYAAAARHNLAMKGGAPMFSEMDTDTFLALVKAHQRELQQQAERDALWRRGMLRKQGKTHAPQWRQALWHLLRHCRRAASMGFYTCRQRRLVVSRTWASGDFSQASRTIRG